MSLSVSLFSRPVLSALKESLTPNLSLSCHKIIFILEKIMVQIESIACWVSSHWLRRDHCVHLFPVLESVMSYGCLKSAITGEVAPEKETNNVYLGANDPTE